ncbi:P450 (cytochrome) oxidoreductase [Monoraphidium neglectum]|uniref:Methionine synthase reductase n=1 Tax=Monoraphidium neglectum TaxID=145388 RepID=A0A0D2LHH3_9CHLO|nr:P450 (cytochrome) oxidoreductase [Monoraphidium neglectum]KIZ05949.1 P450 (cytochrome) oxidoreductase [Monoraphidium neglectum]|eukprot:XP_013904968.1 P450 (cytochrome) oxidoreductase [Monoraphidium neglectum]
MATSGTPAPAAPMTGGAAILARLRAQRGAGAAVGVRSAAAAAATARKAPPRALFLFASQTGTGSEIAKTLAAEAKGHGVLAEAMSLNELGWGNFTPEKAPVVVVVAASTGDGDPPDNSAAFYVQLKKPHPADRLKGVKFAVLGLGDSNYTRFMHVSRTIRSRFTELGASEFIPLVEADEVDGLEGKVDPWCENIWGPLKTALAEAAGNSAAPQATGNTAPPAAVNTAKPAAPAPLAFTPAAAEQQQAAAATAPAGLVDGLAPEGADVRGAPALAEPRIEVVLDVSPEVAQLARERDTSRPTPKQAAYRDEGGTYSAAAPFWAKVAGARLLTAPGSDRVVVHCELDIAGSGMAYTAGDSIGILVQLAKPLGPLKPCLPSLALLLDPKNDPALVDALLRRLGLESSTVFGVKAADGTPSGVSLLPHIEWPCTLSHAFGHGVDITGVPRKSLLRLLAEHCSDAAEKRTLLFLCARAGREDYQREMVLGQPTLLDLLNRWEEGGAATAAAGGDPAVALGEAWLYFGCRRRDEDYLYGAELEAFEASGDLARLRVAFSREGAAKEYVQHLMARDGAALAKLVLQDGAHVFVCGDGAAMAKDVHAALAGALRDYGGLGEAEAEAQLKTMAASGAYVRDVWCA